jgi:predicted DNA-binding transcriptional regulator AlpA
MTDIPFRDRAAHNEVAAHRDRVLNFRQWCQVNGFSEATGHRLIKAGEGPPVLQLSARRIGIRESDNAAWQASRAR